MLNKMKTFIAVAVLSGTVSANAQATTVTVQKGDTLSDLSRVHNTSVENIQKLNHLNTDLIRTGEVLEIAPKKQYTVKQGDTIWDISKDHHVSVSQIKKWNKLSTDTIHPGVSLLIYDGANITKKAATKKPMRSVKPKTSATSPVPAKAKIAAKPKVQTQKKSVQAVKTRSTSKKTQKEITVKATAYTASCTGCSGITKTGINLKANPNTKVIAVDPTVIPLGSKVHVEGFGNAIAADIGGAIKGKRIDIFIPSKKRAINFGVKKLKVTILD